MLLMTDRLPAISASLEMQIVCPFNPQDVDTRKTMQVQGCLDLHYDLKQVCPMSVEFNASNLQLSGLPA